MSPAHETERADESVDLAGRTSPNELASRTAPETTGRSGPGLRCLITNDDGVNSDGLRTLAALAVDAGLDVIVAAPMENCSGASSSISAVETGGRFVVERRHWAGFDDIEIYGVDGLPAFIALTAARGAFGQPPDLVLSGINRGPNTGYAILHSGTVGAALTASTHGCRAMAVSLNAIAGDPHWDTAIEPTAKVLRWLLDAPPGTVFNVNVPDVDEAALKGLEWAELAHFGAVQVNIAEQGEGYFELSLSDINAEYEPGTDAAFLADGYATVTSLNPVCARPALESAER
jgi:5'-nucleotidase